MGEQLDLMAILADPPPATDADVLALVIQALRWADEDGTYEMLGERARRQLAAVLLTPRGTLVEQIAGDADLWRSLHQGLEARVCPALVAAADPLWSASGRQRPRSYNRSGVEVRDYAADVAILAEAAARPTPANIDSLPEQPRSCASTR